MNIAAWVAYPGLFIIMASLVILLRWVSLLQRTVTTQGQRIAHLEGQRDC